MTSEELYCLKGGTTLSTTVLNTIIRLLTTSLELGRSLGTTIRRAIDKKKCNYN